MHEPVLLEESREVMSWLCREGPRDGSTDRRSLKSNAWKGWMAVGSDDSGGPGRRALTSVRCGSYAVAEVPRRNDWSGAGSRKLMRGE